MKDKACLNRFCDFIDTASFTNQISIFLTPYGEDLVSINSNGASKLEGIRKICMKNGFCEDKVFVIANNGGDGIYTTYGATTAVNVTLAGNARGSVTDTSGEATFVNSVLVDNIGEYDDVTMDAINTGATLINCLTGDINEYQHVLTGCISVSKQTVFHSYESGKPVLVQLADGTWAAPISAASAALTGGCATYFSAENGSAAYGDTPTYIAGSEGAVRVTTYQGGTTRTDGVIGPCSQ